MSILVYYRLFVPILTLYPIISSKQIIGSQRGQKETRRKQREYQQDIFHFHGSAGVSGGESPDDIQAYEGRTAFTQDRKEAGLLKRRPGPVDQGALTP